MYVKTSSFSTATYVRKFLTQEMVRFVRLAMVLLGVTSVAILYVLTKDKPMFVNRVKVKNFGLRPGGPVVTERWFVPNITTEMYILSAYYDDRLTIDPKTRPAIRIIGMADKNKVEKEKFSCIVTYEGIKSPILQTITVTDIGRGGSRHGKHFREYIFVCAPLKFTSKKAIFVSVVDQTYLKQYNWESHKQVCIPVRYPSNENKVDFGSCVSITYWTFDPYRIVEWVELHKLWGVKEINIYGSMVNQTTERVFLYYHQQGVLTYTRVPRPMTEDGEIMFHLMATPVLNDCMYKNMYRYGKIVITDLDEMIVPRGNMMTYSELIDAIEKETKPRHPHRMYNFRNVYYFSELPQNTSEPQVTLTLRQTYHLRELTPVGTSTKSIIDPMACRNVHNHYCWKIAEKLEKTRHSVQVHEKFGMNQHYKKCHFDKYATAYHLPPCKEALKNYTFDPTMLKFKTYLLRNIAKPLKDLQLVERNLPSI
ncbi:uncharacterized protein LOC106159479 isoform X1 [Lingula anatina]|uniref:Glycosyltransferase family 92 protein n=1 Tax=Lingula anatina TaxID=7574 RepID=A0A1S3HYX5_LINAN|nr:uncharacterized protein LOC106159479 isoform X1 [Lingula anatina]|eukprot:XP_013391225.1 uncharacterized protein LOC106159479 isoform X1 [Lingula anatina]